MKFSDILRELRKERNITQKQLAEQADLAQSNISAWEIDRSIPLADALIKLADFFGVTIDYLVGREGEDSIITITGNELSDDENHLIDTVRLLNAKNKEVVYQYIEFLLEQQRKGVL